MWACRWNRKEEYSRNKNRWEGAVWVEGSNVGFLVESGARGIHIYAGRCTLTSIPTALLGRLTEPLVYAYANPSTVLASCPVFPADYTTTNRIFELNDRAAHIHMHIHMRGKGFGIQRKCRETTAPAIDSFS